MRGNSVARVRWCSLQFRVRGGHLAVAKKISRSPVSRFREQVAYGQIFTNEMEIQDDMEKIVSAGHLLLASSFEAVFPNVRKPLEQEQVGAEERELLRACRLRALIRFCDQGFPSDIAQKPLRHLFDWMQSKTGEVNLERTKNPGTSQSSQNSTCSSKDKSAKGRRRVV